MVDNSGNGEGGQVKFYPYKMGGGKVLDITKGSTTSFGAFERKGGGGI